jgi:NAD(P)-dependent dehydrogenase (short-subunit alcohol dehydrogenase family)
MDPRGKTVIVTGASCGIGKALARPLVAGEPTLLTLSSMLSSLGSLQPVNQVVAVPAHRLQALDLVGLAWGSAADG